MTFLWLSTWFVIIIIIIIDWWWCTRWYLAYRRKRESNCNILSCSIAGPGHRSSLWRLVSSTRFEESIQHILKYYILGYQNDRHGDGWYVLLWASLLNLKQFSYQFWSTSIVDALVQVSGFFFLQECTFTFRCFYYISYWSYYISLRSVPPWEKGRKNQENYWFRKGTIQIRQNHFRYHWQIVSLFFFHSLFLNDISFWRLPPRWI